MGLQDLLSNGWKIRKHMEDFKRGRRIGRDA
jgi:hypothetical protein